MSEVEHKFNKGQRVRLKGDRSEIYPRAFGGSEGIVKGRKYDETGYYSMVYIEWDENHWCYNGETNMWTLEDHFEPVEKTVMPNEFDDFLGDLAALIEARQRRPVEEDKAPVPAPPQLEDDEPEGRYERNLIQGAKFAESAQAFMVIAVTREPDPTDPNETILIPEVFTDYREDDAALLLDAQLSQVAAAAHTEAVATLIHQLLEERNGDDPS